MKALMTFLSVIIGLGAIRFFMNPHYTTEYKLIAAGAGVAFIITCIGLMCGGILATRRIFRPKPVPFQTLEKF